MAGGGSGGCGGSEEKPEPELQDAGEDENEGAVPGFGAG